MVTVQQPQDQALNSQLLARHRQMLGHQIVLINKCVITINNNQSRTADHAKHTLLHFYKFTILHPTKRHLYSTFGGLNRTDILNCKNHVKPKKLHRNSIVNALYLHHDKEKLQLYSMQIFETKENQFDSNPVVIGTNKNSGRIRDMVTNCQGHRQAFESGQLVGVLSLEMGPSIISVFITCP